MKISIATTSLFACLLVAGVSATAQQPAAMQEMNHAAGVRSTTLTVTGADGKSVTLTAADVAAMPHKTVSVYNAHSKANEVYSGVVLSDLLAKVGVPTGEKLRGKLYLLYVVATGTDKYSVVYSLTETDAANHTGDVIVADVQDGKPIAADGAFKLVSSEEKRPARWVRNLTAVVVKAAE
jgi:hypothetical protein